MLPVELQQADPFLAVRRGQRPAAAGVTGLLDQLAVVALDAPGLAGEVLIRFALSQPIQVAIVGCSSPGHVRMLAQAARRLEPMTDEEKEQISSAFRPHARRLAFYRGVL